MDGAVVGAIITASVALVVAIGGAVRGVLQAAVDRRFERRRQFLMDAQDAMLALREALAAYGAALQHGVSEGAADELHAPRAAAPFLLGVPSAVDLRVSTAQGRLTVARSRLEDHVVDDALARWAATARISMIDPQDVEAVTEEAAFEDANRLIGSALRSVRAR